jgi:signal transduction histidine kinase
LDQAAISTLLRDTGQTIDDLAHGHLAFVFRQRLAIEKASTFGHDMILIAIIPATLLGLLIAIVLSRNLLRAVGTARSLATSIASGNLDNDLRVEGRGEAAQLAQDLLSMQNSLRHNISALKATADALQESENRVRGIAETLPGFLFQCFIAPDDNIRFRVISSNKFVFDSASMTLLKKDGDLSLDFAIEEDRLDLEKAIRGAHDGASDWEHTFRVSTPDGSFRWMRATAAPVEGAGTEKVWNGIALDETDRIAAAAQNAQLQARLQQAEKMESIGTLAGGMAHEINNLLQPVIMMTEFVLMETPETSSQHTRLQQVVNAGTMAAEIVQRLVAFGRIQESSQTTLDIAVVARDAVALIRTMLPSSITLHVEVDDDVGKVRGDKTQLTQVLINLAANARDAVGGRVGDVWVSLSRPRTGITISTSGGRTLAPGTFVTMAVRDSGTGMDEATLRRIFEPFFTTKGVGQGTGLGLSVTHGIVAGHGGAIQVESTPGKGTQFSIHLPIESDGAILALAS